MSTTMKIQLSDHFDYKRLILFSIPSILMMIFSSLYSMVDGYCVSNFVGKDALASVNLIMPFPIICSTIGMMLSTGGAAYIARTLGQQKNERANGIFSLVVITSILIGLIGSVIGFVFIPNIAVFLGANEVLLPYCIIYGRIFMLSILPFTLQVIFQVLFVTAERPRLGLFFILLSGMTNIVLDFLLLGKFHMGIDGAAWATFISCMIGCFGPLCYFMKSNDCILHLTRPIWDWRALIDICWNGFSEMVNSVSASVCAILYNLQLMRIIGEDGVAAYGVIMYVNFIFLALIGGYLTGLENVIGYHYGAGNNAELQNLRRRSFNIIMFLGIFMFVSAEISAPSLAKIFVGYDESLTDISIRAFRLYAFSFLVMGFNGFTSTLFTALGNGLISAIISFCHTFVFEILSVLLLPLLLGLDGVWIALAVAEICCLFVSYFFYVKYKKHYLY